MLWEISMLISEELSFIFLPHAAIFWWSNWLRISYSASPWQPGTDSACPPITKAGTATLGSRSSEERRGEQQCVCRGERECLPKPEVQTAPGEEPAQTPSQQSWCCSWPQQTLQETGCWAPWMVVWLLNQKAPWALNAGEIAKEYKV